MGAYMEREIPHGLEQGHSYTARQIQIFIVENPDVKVFFLNGQLSEYDPDIHEVVEVYDGYFYYAERKGTLRCPATKGKLYIIN